MTKILNSLQAISAGLCLAVGYYIVVYESNNDGWALIAVGGILLIEASIWRLKE